MRIAINGMGVAGPTLAFWLQQCGHEVLLVEEAPALRSGGYVVDFWGLGYDVAERMGLIPRIRGLGYQVREVRFVDAHARKRGGFTVEIFGRLTGGRFTSVRRSDLSAAIFGSLDGRVETIFGDSIASLEETGRKVRIGFEHASVREVDLVIGADGLHSRVRELAFEPGDWSEVYLGYHVAAFEVKGYRPRDELVYITHNKPGRQLSRLSMREDKTLFLFIVRDEHLPAVSLSTEAERKMALAAAFSGVGWECPRILAEMEQAEGFYFDRVSQIRMKRWSKGRVALVGDAAACVSLLAGEGTGLAMGEAYVLAGEMRASRNDHVAAFARYQERLLPLLKQKQGVAAKFASSFTPKTTLGINVRDLVTRFMDIPIVAEYIIGRDLRDVVPVPDYGM